MTRRGFLSALAALPLVGWMFPKSEPLSYAEKGYPRIYGRPMLGHTSRLRITRSGPGGRELWEYFCRFCGVTFQKATVYTGCSHDVTATEEDWLATPCPARSGSYRYEPTTTLPEVRWREPKGDMEEIVAEIHRGREL